MIFNICRWQCLFNLSRIFISKDIQRCDWTNKIIHIFQAPNDQKKTDDSLCSFWIVSTLDLMTLPSSFITFEIIISAGFYQHIFFLSGRRRIATKFHCINCRLCSPFWMWMSIKSQSMNKARVFYGFVSFVGLEDVCIFYFFLLWLISVVIIKRHKRHPYFLHIIFRSVTI